MKKLLLISLVALVTQFVKAQGCFQLDQKICDTTGFIFADMVQRNDGSFFVIGNKDVGALNFYPCLIKYDANYNEVMRRVYLGSIFRQDLFLHLKELPNKNLLLVATFESRDGDFAGIDTSTAACFKVMVAEIDTFGTILKYQLYRNCGTTYPTQVDFDKHGNIYIAGYTAATDFDFSANPEGGLTTNAFLIRLDRNLNKKWVKIMHAQGDQDIEPCIAINNKDEILFATSTNDYASGFLTATLPTLGGKVFLSCIDSNQQLLWQKCFGSQVGISLGLGEATSKLMHDSIHNQTYIVGYCNTKNGDMYDSLDKNLYSSLSTYTIKVDSVGNKIWSHRYGAFSPSNPINGDYRSVYAEESIFHNNRLYILNNVLYTDTNWTGIAVNDDQQWDQWLIELDTNGRIINKQRFGNAGYDGQGELNPSLLRFNKISNRLILGFSSTQVNCHVPITYGYQLFEAEKLPASVIDIKKKELKVTLVPNPAGNTCTLKFNESSREDINLQIKNLQGQIIKTETIKRNTTNYTLHIPDLVQGIYTIVLQSKTASSVLKLQKE
jgi:hypothetical protein